MTPSGERLVNFALEARYADSLPTSLAVALEAQYTVTGWSNAQIPTRTFAKAWVQLIDAVSLLGDLQDGTADWSRVDPDMPAGDRHGYALAIAQGRVDDAVQELLAVEKVA